MESRQVKVTKAAVCKDPSRKSAWQVTMHTPIDREQFEIVQHIIRSLCNISGSYLIVNLAAPIQKLEYIQMCQDKENLWRVELHFDQPDVFTYRRNGKIYVRKHPWTQKKQYMHSIQKTIRVFRDVLCHARIPDLSDWKNCTREIYLERFRHQES